MKTIDLPALSWWGSCVIFCGGLVWRSGKSLSGNKPTAEISQSEALRRRRRMQQTLSAKWVGGILINFQLCKSSHSENGTTYLKANPLETYTVYWWFLQIFAILYKPDYIAQRLQAVDRVVCISSGAWTMGSVTQRISHMFFPPALFPI